MYRDLSDLGLQIQIRILPMERTLKLRSFHAPWSVWSWITNPNPDRPKGMHLNTFIPLFFRRHLAHEEFNERKSDVS